MFWYLRQHLSTTKILKAKSWQFIGKYCSSVLQQKLNSTQTVSGVMKLFKTGAREEPAGAALTCTAQTAPKLWEHKPCCSSSSMGCEQGLTIPATAPAVPWEPGLLRAAGSPQEGMLCESWELPAQEKALKGSVPIWLLDIWHVSCIRQVVFKAEEFKQP